MAWLNNMKCSGNERSLFDCVHDGLKTHNCGQGRKAGVICKSKGEVHYKLCFDLLETGIQGNNKYFFPMRHVQKCTRWQKWRKFANVWRIFYDKAKGPFDSGKFGENGELNSRQSLANVPIRWLRVSNEILCKLLHCWELLLRLQVAKIKVWPVSDFEKQHAKWFVNGRTCNIQHYWELLADNVASLFAQGRVSGDVGEAKMAKNLRSWERNRCENSF